MNRLVLTIFSAVWISGCAGTPFEWNAARKIKDGMTTNEVTTLVGPPNNVRAQGDTIRYVWVYVDAFQGSRTLVVEFKDGKVIKAPPIPDSF